MTVTLKKMLALVLLLQLSAFAVFAADQVQIREDAPSRYQVLEGDTLWDISGRFLEDPWLWPEVWALNPQIENPHLIYPGDIIELEYTADGPLLTLRRGGDGAPNADGLRTVRLSPQVRRQALGSSIPAIPADEINAMLSRNIVVPVSVLNAAPYLLDNRSGKLFTSDNDVVFAKGNWNADILRYDIVRPGREYTDPDTGAVIGTEGILVGSATIIDRDDDNATLSVNQMLREARTGDRFVPSISTRIESTYFPEPPAIAINASILDIGSGRSLGSVYDTILINKGSRDRLQVGDLLGLQKPDIVVEDEQGEATIGERFKRALGFSREHVETFDGEIYASVLIYRVFDNASFGIILSSNQMVRLEDKVITP